jgi:uncharacterized membrane protein (UPF0127 family)
VDRDPSRVPIRLRGLPHAAVAGRRVPVATRPLTRLLGLSMLDRDRAGPGLLIPRCRCVHTFGMRFPIDIVFVDRAGAVIARRAALPPGRVAFDRRAVSVLELPTGTEFDSARDR